MRCRAKGIADHILPLGDLFLSLLSPLILTDSSLLSHSPRSLALLLSVGTISLTYSSGTKWSAQITFSTRTSKRRSGRSRSTVASPPSYWPIPPKTEANGRCSSTSSRNTESSRNTPCRNLPAPKPRGGEKGEIFWIARTGGSFAPSF